MDKKIKGQPVKCDCGKLVAVKRNGIIYIRCHGCKREVAIDPRGL